MEWNRLCPSSRDADSRQIEEQLDGRMKSRTVQNELNDNTRKLDILWDFGVSLCRRLVGHLLLSSCIMRHGIFSWEENTRKLHPTQQGLEYGV